MDRLLVSCVVGGGCDGGSSSRLQSVDKCSEMRKSLIYGPKWRCLGSGGDLDIYSWALHESPKALTFSTLLALGIAQIILLERSIQFAIN